MKSIPDTLGVEESSSPKTIPTRTSNGPRASGGAIWEDYPRGNRGETSTCEPLASVFPPPRQGVPWALGPTPNPLWNDGVGSGWVGPHGTHWDVTEPMGARGPPLSGGEIQPSRGSAGVGPPPMAPL